MFFLMFTQTELLIYAVSSNKTRTAIFISLPQTILAVPLFSSRLSYFEPLNSEKVCCSMNIIMIRQQSFQVSMPAPQHSLLSPKMFGLLTVGYWPKVHGKHWMRLVFGLVLLSKLDTWSAQQFNEIGQPCSHVQFICEIFASTPARNQKYWRRPLTQ